MAKIAQLVEGNYNILDNIPVINQDLTESGFTPVANTYYRHTGATTDTFTQGVIYLYDTAYHKLGESGGGISDVKVNGTSVVADGVANIPPASTSANGVVTTGAQTISGKKDFYNILAREFTYKGRYMNFELSSNDSTGTYGGLCVQAANSKAESISYYFYDDRRKKNYIILRPTDKGSDAILLYNNGKSYKAMISPTTWSSGTSGSVTLTESGTYQIKSNLGDAIVVYDGTSQVQSAIIYADSSNLYYYHISAEGVLTVSYVGKNDSTSGSSTNYEIKYRKIGIA